MKLATQTMFEAQLLSPPSSRPPKLSILVVNLLFQLTSLMDFRFSYAVADDQHEFANLLFRRDACRLPEDELEDASKAEPMLSQSALPSPTPAAASRALPPHDGIDSGNWLFSLTRCLLLLYTRPAKQSIKDEGGEEKKEENPAPRMGARDGRILRKLLLSIIRGHYIEAISRLPAAVLTTARAHGLLVGGHCYGPFRPVENIIINSVWYAAAFPFRSGSIDVAVVSAEGISRLAHRSLDGLVAILRHHCPGLSHDDALWQLCLSGADLHGAASSVRGAAPFTRTELEAVPFQVAAQAAGHPKPAALALFVTSLLPNVERYALSLLAAKHTLCLSDILCLSAMLLPFLQPEEQPPQPSPQEQNPEVFRIFGEKRKYLKIWYQNLLDIADAALRKFVDQTGEQYHLHTIYGQSIVNNEDYLLDRYIHINLMVWRKVGSSSSACQTEAPVHFFAEAHNPPTKDCPEECITLCCMLAQLSPRHVDNCYACMTEHQKIDHPDAETHFGGHPHKTVETENDSDFPSTDDIDVDFRFFDPDKDIDLIQFYADRVARIKAIRSEFRSRNRRVNEDGATCSKIRFDEDDSEDEDISSEDTSDECDFCIQYI